MAAYEPTFQHACQVLIIDEVSMVSAEFLEQLEQSARQLRGSKAPFGGIQLVLSGDFFQLRARAA